MSCWAKLEGGGGGPVAEGQYGKLVRTHAGPHNHPGPHTR